MSREVTRVKTEEVFKFDELSWSAKDTARWEYSAATWEDSWWSDAVKEDAKEMAKLLGINIDNIYWSGFSSQGDGAQFEGEYWYKTGCQKAIREAAPQDKELHRIADELVAIQRPNFYHLSAFVKHSGHYYHEYCTSIRVVKDDGHGWEDVCPIETDEALRTVLRDFMRWIYKQLESAYDYSISDEHIIEESEKNGWEYTKDGKLYGERWS